MSTSKPIIDTLGAGASQPPAVDVKGISLTINGVSILSDVTFAIGVGEVIGLIGPNGAGKTSLINVLSGVTRPTKGSVRIFGDDVTAWKPHRRAQIGLGRTFQTSNLYGGLSAIANVRLAVQADDPALLKGFSIRTSSGAAEERARRALHRVGLDDKHHVLAGSMSHGDKRKLEIAMVVATGARLMLLDEPMAGVNVEDIDPLIKLIKEIHEETNATVLIVEHHLDVVLSVSERLAVMHHGALLAIDAPEVVIENPTVQSAYIGEAL